MTKWNITHVTAVNVPVCQAEVFHLVSQNPLEHFVALLDWLNPEATRENKWMHFIVKLQWQLNISFVCDKLHSRSEVAYAVIKYVKK